MKARAAGTLIGLALTAVVAAGCGGSSGSGQTPTVSNLTRAADISSSAPGYKVAMTLSETIAGAGQISMSGRGSFSPASHTGTMTAHMALPPSAGLGTLQLQMVLDKTSAYMKLPPQYASKIPGGKPWLYIDLTQLAKAAGIPGLGSLVSGTSSLNDPGQYLSFLRATAVGSIKDLGPATVNGVRTTHYAAEVDLAKLPAAVPAADRTSIQRLVAALQQKGVSGEMPINAWIDASHLIRRIQTAYSTTISGQSVSANITEDFLQYGPQPAPTVPSPSESVNLLSLVKGSNP